MCVKVMLKNLLTTFHLLFIVQVVQEYERAVIFRLGRLVKGGAKVRHVFISISLIIHSVDVESNVQAYQMKINVFRVLGSSS